jgi:hypothetical protein
MKDFGPVLCGIARDQTLQSNISANLKQSWKMCWRVSDSHKKRGSKSRDTVSF